MRLIDADAAIDRYYGEWEKQGIWDGDQDRDWLMRCIEEAPTLTLPEEIEQLKRERDAAIEDIFNFSSNKCFCCAHNTHKWLSDGGMDDLCKTCLENGKCNWKWRGVQKEEER